MKCKKNILDYFIWVLLFGIISAAFATASIRLLARAGITDKRFMILLICLFFVAEVLLYFLLYSVFQYLQKEPLLLENRHYQYIEKIFFIILIMVLLGIRIGYVHLNGIQVADGQNFYKMAEITEQNASQPMVHNVSYVYTGLLSILFSFVGNKIEMIVYLQTALQMISVFFLFAGIRKMLGKSAAFFFLLAAIFVPVFTENLNVLSSDSLICVMMGALLYFNVSALERFTLQETGTVLTGILLFISGFLTACAGYLDILGYVFFLTAFIAMIQVITKCRLRVRLLSIFLFIIGFITGFSLFIILECNLYQISITDCITQVIQMYMNLFHPAFPVYENLQQEIVILALCVFAGMNVIGFFKQKYDKSLMGTMLLAGGIAIQVCSLSSESYPMWNTILWIVAAASGIQLFADFYYGKELSMQSAVSQCFDTAKEVKPEVRDKTKPIPNPLPGPRKHEKKELEYSFLPEEKAMKFDVDITGQDDFDIE